MVGVCELQPRERVRTVRYMDCELRRERRMVNETSTRVIEEEQTVYYTVCVPRQFEQEIDVPVCRMVLKIVEVPACCDVCGK